MAKDLIDRTGVDVEHDAHLVAQPTRNICAYTAHPVNGVVMKAAQRALHLIRE